MECFLPTRKKSTSICYNWKYSPLGRDCTALSPVIGVILLIFMTFLFAGIVISGLYGHDMACSLRPAPMAVIEIESIRGGVPNEVRYEENFIVLVHRSGAPLDASSVKIVASGRGSSYTGAFGSGTKHYGDISIIYEHIGYDGKLVQYKKRNHALSDGLWSAGEKISLCGNDSINGTDVSSVVVHINGMTNTSNNYGLRKDTLVDVVIIDAQTNKVIASMEHKVTPVK